MKYKARARRRGDSACPPIPPLRFVITAITCMRGYCILEEAEKPGVKFLLNVQLDSELFL